MSVPSFDHQRIFLVGDSHGNANFISNAIEMAIEQRADVIIQLGDFGFWEHTAKGLAFMNFVEAELAEFEEESGTRLELWFLDGNHENHDMLDELSRDEFDRGFVRDHIRHLPRGWRGELAGFTWGFLGGAYSIDHRRRVLGHSLWRGEQLTDADVEALGTDALQVLCAHDVFDGVPLDEVCPWRFELPEADENASHETRKRLREAVDATRPAAFFHGHWHNHYRYTTEACTVIGLGAESIQLATLLVGADGAPIS